jgi:Ca2+-binding EF-hand superfamily protein
MRRFNSILLLSIFSLAFFSCEREEELSFADFDNDNDNLIDREEFKETFTANYYDDWNNQDDDYLDDEDFYVSVYDMWDADEDEVLTEEEWIMGYDYYYGDYIVNDYEAVDVDGDGFIEYAEYNDVLGDSDFFATWDVDASEYLSEEELAEGVFTIWDVDNSGYLERDEYDEFDAYYLDI